MVSMCVCCTRLVFKNATQLPQNTAATTTPNQPNSVLIAISQKKKVLRYKDADIATNETDGLVDGDLAEGDSLSGIQNADKNR